MATMQSRKTPSVDKASPTNERALCQAPIIENWCFDVQAKPNAWSGTLVLQGDVTGHPRFPGTVRIQTSHLLAFNRKERWARTGGRFYRLGASLYDEKLDLAPDTSAEEVQQLREYVGLCRSLPRPARDQMRAFADYVSTAHSWYKHLPCFPPGAPFYFYFDPAAGLQRVVRPDGSVEVMVREGRGSHYSWLPTAEYREKFGYLAFAQAQGTHFEELLPSGGRLVPSDDLPTFYHFDRARVSAVPKPILALGTSYASAIVHGVSMEIGFQMQAHAGRPAWPQTWPDESGGPRQLEKIVSRVKELLRDPSVRKEPPLRDLARHGLGADLDLISLLTPELERERRQMVAACARVSSYCWDDCFGFTTSVTE